MMRNMMILIMIMIMMMKRMLMINDDDDNNDENENDAFVSLKGEPSYTSTESREASDLHYTLKWKYYRTFWT